MSDPIPNPNPPQRLPSNATGLGLGIAGLVLGIIGLLGSFIPCLGALAMWISIPALLLALFGYLASKKISAPTGLAMAAIIISLLGTGISIYERIRVQRAAEKLRQDLDKGFDEAKKELDAASKKLQQSR